MRDSHASRTVVNSVVKLAHELGIRVTAEGVEQDTQLHFLRGIGCDQWQGYLMSPAIAPADLMTLVRNQAADAKNCLLYTSPSPRDRTRSRMPSSA